MIIMEVRKVGRVMHDDGGSTHDFGERCSDLQAILYCYKTKNKYTKTKKSFRPRVE